MTDLSPYSMITNDSRAVKAGAIFAALPGAAHDGRDYIDAAINAGATYILAPQGTPRPEGDFTWQESQNIRADYARLCAALCCVCYG